MLSTKMSSFYGHYCAPISISFSFFSNACSISRFNVLIRIDRKKASGQHIVVKGCEVCFGDTFCKSECSHRLSETVSDLLDLNTDNISSVDQNIQR